MPIPWTQEQQNEYLLRNSIMQAEQSPYAKISSAIFGRTLPEQANNSMMGPLGSTQIAKISPQIADQEVIRRALRAMGREVLNFMRKTGQKIVVAPRDVAGELGSHTRLGKTHIVTLGPENQKATAYHEITGHAFEDALRAPSESFQAARDFLDAQEGLPSLKTKLEMRRYYRPSEVPGEAYAAAREPIDSTKWTFITPKERTFGNNISRAARKDLRDLMRKNYQE